MPITVEKNKWILYKHTSNYEMIKAVALDVKNSCKTDISDIERHRMQERLAALNLYHTRNPSERPLDSINHRINTLEFWMFGYENIGSEKKFIFSPLGNLFLKYINNDEKLTKIFITMLFAIQFEHPASGTNKKFQLYPFRLIFKLLSDDRLGGRLYNYEYSQIIAFVDKVNTIEEYEEIVDKIINLRSKSINDIRNTYVSDEHTYVNAVYEWEYYTCKLFSSIGIFKKTEGLFICKLYHPTKSGSHSNPTGRSATTGYVELTEYIKQYLNKLLNVYSFLQTPISLNEDGRMQIDIIKEIYSFYPDILMNELGESQDLTNLLELPKHIEQYSNNPENDTAYLFEEVLTQGFDLFYNVKANRRGGSGKTDIECLYIDKKKKFAVESKSTANKLIGINAGRLREQREKVGGAYTIVITPRYVPATVRDIYGTPIVIVLANTFAEYLYNNIFNEIRNIDYGEIDNIITSHLGEDISNYISELTIKKFATN